MEKVYGSANSVAGTALAKLLSEGRKPIPTQWIDTDKHERLKREGKKRVPFYLKANL